MIRHQLGFATMAGGVYAFSQASWEAGLMLSLLGVALAGGGGNSWDEGGDPDDGGADGGGD